MPEVAGNILGLMPITECARGRAADCSTANGGGTSHLGHDRLNSPATAGHMHGYHSTDEWMATMKATGRMLRPRWWITAVAALAAAPVLMITTNAYAHTGPPNLCLVNSASEKSCIDVTSTAAGNSVFMYDRTSSPGNADNWFTTYLLGTVCTTANCHSSGSGPWPFSSGTGLNSTYKGDQVFEIGSFSATCVGEVGGNVVLQNYPGESGRGCLWVYGSVQSEPDPNDYINVERTQHEGFGELLTADGTANGDGVITQPRISGDWQRFGLFEGS